MWLENILELAWICHLHGKENINWSILKNGGKNGKIVILNTDFVIKVFSQILQLTHSKKKWVAWSIMIYVWCVPIYRQKEESSEGVTAKNFYFPAADG